MELYLFILGKGRLASPYAWPVIRYLQDASRSPVFWKNNGHDHFVFFSLTEFVMTGNGYYLVNYVLP